MSSGAAPSFVARTVWTPQQFEADRREAEEYFRRERLQEPLEAYLEQFDRVQGAFEDLIESTLDLSLLEEQALDILTDPVRLESFRYLTGPPMSEDDLKTIAEAQSIAPRTLRSNPEMVQRLITTIRENLDRRRFPWVTEGREATEIEKDQAVLASAALVASSRTATIRRNEAKRIQEERVRQALLEHGFQEIQLRPKRVRTLANAPQPGQFCKETYFGDRKADLLVGLWDHRVLPIECKVSNSSTNSIKRLNGDAAVKAEHWMDQFGRTQVVPVALLSGVYKLLNLEQAQSRGLTIYWAHRLKDLTDWIETTR